MDRSGHDKRHRSHRGGERIGPGVDIKRGDLFEEERSADSGLAMLLRLLAGCTIPCKKRTNSALKSRFVWYNYGTFSYFERQHPSNQFRSICTFGTRNLTAIGTTANRARSGELAVLPLELGGRIFAKNSSGQL